MTQLEINQTNEIIKQLNKQYDDWQSKIPPCPEHIQLYNKRCPECCTRIRIGWYNSRSRI